MYSSHDEKNNDKWMMIKKMKESKQAREGKSKA
jgi:hypothetical protein